MSSATTSGPRARQPQSRPGIAVNKARLGRVALILLLLLMASSYVRPALDWVNARGTAAQQEQRLVKLQASEKQLKADKVRLSTARGWPWKHAGWAWSARVSGPTSCVGCRTTDPPGPTASRIVPGRS